MEPTNLMHPKYANTSKWASVSELLASKRRSEKVKDFQANLLYWVEAQGFDENTDLKTLIDRLLDYENGIMGFLSVNREERTSLNTTFRSTLGFAERFVSYSFSQLVLAGRDYERGDLLACACLFESIPPFNTFFKQYLDRCKNINNLIQAFLLDSRYTSMYPAFKEIEEFVIKNATAIINDDYGTLIYKIKNLGQAQKATFEVFKGYVLETNQNYNPFSSKKP